MSQTAREAGYKCFGQISTNTFLLFAGHFCFVWMHSINKFYRVDLKKHKTYITLKRYPSPKRGIYFRRPESTNYSVRNPPSTGPLP